MHVHIYMQLVTGDQLTCKNIRGSKLWKASEVNVTDRLTWAYETPGRLHLEHQEYWWLNVIYATGDFHFLWECLQVIFRGTLAEHGSLCNVREQIRQNQVDKDVKVFSVGGEFVIHSFKVHLKARICTIFGLQSASDIIPHEKSLAWLQSTAEELVTETDAYTRTIQWHTIQHAQDILHLAFLYVDLRCAIRYEHGPHIVRLWKLWLPRLIGTGRKNYAVECVH